MNRKIADFMEATNGTAANMTHYLSVLGNGDMGTGIRKLWSTGYMNGAASATVVISAGLYICFMATKPWRDLKKVELIGDAFHKGYEVGQRKEREFQEFITERNGDDVVD